MTSFSLNHAVAILLIDAWCLVLAQGTEVSIAFLWIILIDTSLMHADVKDINLGKQSLLRRMMSRMMSTQTSWSMRLYVLWKDASSGPVMNRWSVFVMLITWIRSYPWEHWTYNWTLGNHHYIIGCVSSLYNIGTWYCFVQNLTVYPVGAIIRVPRGCGQFSYRVLRCGNWRVPFNKTTCFVSLAGPAVLFDEISCETGVWPALLILSKTSVGPALGVGAFLA